jgi:hypothetical protein
MSQSAADPWVAKIAYSRKISSSVRIPLSGIVSLFSVGATYNEDKHKSLNIVKAK